MSNYVRVKLSGGCYFFIMVTFNRHKFLTSELAHLKSNLLGSKNEPNRYLLILLLYPGLKDESMVTCRGK